MAVSFSIEATEVTFPGEGAQLRAVLCRPAGGQRRPGVLVLHDVFGLTGHVRGVATRLAQEGFVALAPDLYSRGDGLVDAYEETRRRMKQFPDGRTIADVLHSVRYLKGLSCVSGPVGAVGFSFGARYGLFAAARTPDLAVIAFFYGILVYDELTAARPVQPLDAVQHLRCNVLCFFAGRDKRVPNQDSDRMRRLLERHSVPHEFHRYEQAKHGFFNETVKAYDPQLAQQAWDITLRFLRQHLGQGVP